MDKNTGKRAANAFQQSTAQAEQNMARATEGFREYQLNIVAAAQDNINAIFEYMKDALKAQSVSELIELSTSHSRRTFEMMADQARQVTSAAQNIMGAGWRSGSS